MCSIVCIRGRYPVWVGMENGGDRSFVLRMSIWTAAIDAHPRIALHTKCVWVCLQHRMRKWVREKAKDRWTLLAYMQHVYIPVTWESRSEPTKHTLLISMYLSYIYIKKIILSIFLFFYSTSNLFLLFFISYIYIYACILDSVEEY